MSRIPVWCALLALGCKEVPPAEPEPEPEPPGLNGCVTFDLVPAVKGCWVFYIIDDEVDYATGGQTWVAEDGAGRVCVEYREQETLPRIIAISGFSGSPQYELESVVAQPGIPECGRDACVHLGEVPCNSECWGGPEIGVPCSELECCDMGSCRPDGNCRSNATGD